MEERIRISIRIPDISEELYVLGHSFTKDMSFHELIMRNADNINEIIMAEYPFNSEDLNYIFSDVVWSDFHAILDIIHRSVKTACGLVDFDILGIYRMITVISVPLSNLPEGVTDV